MNFNRQVTPEVYFDIRLPSRVCLIVIVVLALSVGIFLAWFTHQTSHYINKTTTWQPMPVVDQ